MARGLFRHPPQPQQRRPLPPLPESPEKSSSDSGVGADAASVLAALSGSETGAATEAASLAAAVPASDSGVGTDSRVNIGLASSDSGVGTDSGAVAAAVPASDSGTGTDSRVNIGLAASDSGVGTESATVQSGYSSSDSGTGTDTGAVAAAVPASESGAGTETGAVVAALPGSDSGTGTDAATLVAAVPASDSGVGTDSATVTVAISASDSGVGTDTATDRAFGTGDSGVGSDAASVDQGAAFDAAKLAPWWQEQVEQVDLTQRWYAHEYEARPLHFPFSAPVAYVKVQPDGSGGFTIGWSWPGLLPEGHSFRKAAADVWERTDRYGWGIYDSIAPTPDEVTPVDGEVFDQATYGSASWIELFVSVAYWESPAHVDPVVAATFPSGATAQAGEGYPSAILHIPIYRPGATGQPDTSLQEAQSNTGVRWLDPSMWTQASGPIPPPPVVRFYLTDLPADQLKYQASEANAKATLGRASAFLTADTPSATYAIKQTATGLVYYWWVGPILWPDGTDFAQTFLTLHVWASEDAAVGNDSLIARIGYSFSNSNLGTVGPHAYEEPGRLLNVGGRKVWELTVRLGDGLSDQSAIEGTYTYVSVEVELPTNAGTTVRFALGGQSEGVDGDSWIGFSKLLPLAPLTAETEQPDLSLQEARSNLGQRWLDPSMWTEAGVHRRFPQAPTNVVVSAQPNASHIDITWTDPPFLYGGWPDYDVVAIFVSRFADFEGLTPHEWQDGTANTWEEGYVLPGDQAGVVSRHDYPLYIRLVANSGNAYGAPTPAFGPFQIPAGDFYQPDTSLQEALTTYPRWYQADLDAERRAPRRAFDAPTNPVATWNEGTGHIDVTWTDPAGMTPGTDFVLLYQSNNPDMSPYQALGRWDYYNSADAGGQFLVYSGAINPGQTVYFRLVPHFPDWTDEGRGAPTPIFSATRPTSYTDAKGAPLWSPTPEHEQRDQTQRWYDPGLYGEVRGPRMGGLATGLTATPTSPGHWDLTWTNPAGTSFDEVVWYASTDGIFDPTNYTGWGVITDAAGPIPVSPIVSTYYAIGIRWYEGNNRYIEPMPASIIFVAVTPPQDVGAGYLPPTPEWEQRDQTQRWFDRSVLDERRFPQNPPAYPYISSPISVYDEPLRYYWSWVWEGDWIPTYIEFEYRLPNGSYGSSWTFTGTAGSGSTYSVVNYYELGTGYSGFRVNTFNSPTHGSTWFITTFDIGHNQRAVTTTAMDQPDLSLQETGGNYPRWYAPDVEAFVPYVFDRSITVTESGVGIDTATVAGPYSSDFGASFVAPTPEWEQRSNEGVRWLADSQWTEARGVGIPTQLATFYFDTTWGTPALFAHGNKSNGTGGAWAPTGLRINWVAPDGSLPANDYQSLSFGVTSWWMPLTATSGNVYLWADGKYHFRLWLTQTGTGGAWWDAGEYVTDGSPFVWLPETLADPQDATWQSNYPRWYAPEASFEPFIGLTSAPTTAKLAGLWIDGSDQQSFSTAQRWVEPNVLIVNEPPKTWLWYPSAETLSHLWLEQPGQEQGIYPRWYHPSTEPVNDPQTFVSWLWWVAAGPPAPSVGGGSAVLIDVDSGDVFLNLGGPLIVKAT